MPRSTLIIVSLIAVLCISLFGVLGKRNTVSEKPSLLLNCAAGMRQVVAEIASDYEKETGIHVQIQFGGSGALEAQLEIAGGDLFLPADSFYLDSVREKGLLKTSFPAANLTAGIVVPKGNPKKLTTLADLTRPGIRLSMADPSAAIGKHVREVLAETGDLAAVTANVVVTKPTVNNTIEDVAIGAVDATIAWDAVASGFENVEWISVPAFAERSVETGIGILLSSQHPEQAQHFARYLTDKEEGRKTFEKHGFTWGKNIPSE